MLGCGASHHGCRSSDTARAGRWLQARPAGQRGTRLTSSPGCLLPPLWLLAAQVALKPFSTQIYDFIASMPGAYWYHSHFK